MAEGVPRTSMRHLREEQVGTPFPLLQPRKEAWVRAMAKKELGKRLHLQGLRGPFCQQEAALRNETAVESPWEARRGGDGHPEHWPVDTARTGAQKEATACELKEVFMLWTRTASVRRGRTAHTCSHGGAGGAGRGQGSGWHALEHPDPFGGQRGGQF